MILRRRALTLAIAALAAGALVPIAHAQQRYPVKPVRWIIEERDVTGTSAIDSGMAGSSGKLSRDIPAIRVRDLPEVILAQ